MTECTEPGSILITQLPAIIIAIGTFTTALGTILTAYWSYQSKQQSTANAVGIEAVQTNVMKALPK